MRTDLVACGVLLVALGCYSQITTTPSSETTPPVCPTGKYGVNCSSTCSANCNPIRQCNAVDGSCPCQPGWTGSHCTTECPQGKYGINCASSCSVNCNTTRRCNHVSGSCSCQNGWTGSQCTQACANGFYGLNCSQTCGKCAGGSVCNKATGACPGDCQPGYNPADNTCHTACENGKWGQNCGQTCSQHCTGVCSKMNGQCTCKPGYKPYLCTEACENGKWGQNCGGTCSQHCTGVCSKVNGQCTCKPGYEPNLCTEACRSGTYGQNCGQTCGHCHGQAPCHPVLGHCSRCEDNRQFPFCQDCIAGQWGASCGQRCGQCGGNGSCDPVNGTCLATSCQAGWTSRTCDVKCPNQSFGVGCALKCGHCRNNSPCRHDSGICEQDCEDGYTGVHCKTEKESLVALIVGSVVGVGVLLAIVIVGALWFFTRRRSPHGPKVPQKDFMADVSRENTESNQHEEVAMGESQLYQNLQPGTSSRRDYDRTHFSGQDAHTYAVHTPGENRKQEAAHTYQNTGPNNAAPDKGPKKRSGGGALLPPEGTYGNVSMPPPDATYGNLDSAGRAIYGNVQP